MADKPQVEMTDEERRADFERRMITDYSKLPPEYVEELQRRMDAAAAEDRRAS